MPIASQLNVTGGGDYIELVTHVDTEDLDALNAEQRRLNPKGWTKRRTLRLVAQIDPVFIGGLVACGDTDARDLVESRYRNKAALRRLLAKWPEMRACDGVI